MNYRFIQELINVINYQLQGLGFRDVSDFLTSTFHFNSLSRIGLVIIGILGGFATFLEHTIGLTPIVYSAFVLLLVGEFVTGLAASLKRREKIQSRKFGRMVVKIGVYTAILGILFTFQTGLKIPILFGSQINIYEWLYFAVLNMIIIQLVISVFENLDKLGMTESVLILRVLKNKLYKWFLNDTQPDDDFNQPQNQ